VAAAAKRVPVADLAHELVHGVVGFGVGSGPALPGAMAAVRLPGALPMTAAIPPAMAATVASAMPAAIALATAVVLGQGGLPGQPKLAVVDGQAGRHRDQGKGRATGEEQTDDGRGGP
jgi:hypothetical protein